MFSVKLKRTLLALILSLLSMIIPACNASYSDSQVDEELVTFMLAHIVNNYVGDHIASIAPIEQADPGVVQVPSIIIWAPPGKDLHSPGEILDRDQPIRVWMYIDQQLIQMSDANAAIEQYLQKHIHYSVTESWGFYDFGIFSVSKDRQSAEVYLGISCGPMCGSGYMYTLQRDSSGAWEIIEAELVWIV